jgi:hypothetical protein
MTPKAKTMQDDVNSPVQSCPGPCDAVIPIVYPNQPITVPYSAIRGQMSIFQRAAIDEEESVRQTFTKPAANPPLAISETTSSGVKVTGLGHAGVAFYNGLTGEVAYHEYGRYGGDFGAVRSVSMPTLSFGADHNPTQGSFNALLVALTKTNGGPYAFESVFVKLPNGSFDKMKQFAEDRKAAVAARTAAAYDVKNNHCFTFAVDVAEHVGVSRSVAGAQPLDIILVDITGTRRDAPAGTSIELPSRQIRQMQTRYRALNVSAAGTPGPFTFPVAPYLK